MNSSRPARAASGSRVDCGTIRQTVQFRAGPREVFEALLDARKVAAFTGCPARVSRKAGGRFAILESLRGRNLDLVPGRRIVQSWQCDVPGWPARHHSTLTLRLSPTDTGTRLRMEHSEVPAACLKPIAAAWRKFYWQPLRRWLQTNAAKTI